MKSKKWFYVLLLCCIMLTVQAGIATADDTCKGSAPAEAKAGAKPGAPAGVGSGGATMLGPGVEPAKPAIDPESKEAVVHMPGLTEKNIQTSLDILKKIEGIQSMRPDFDQKMIYILYKGDLDFDAVLEKLKDIEPEAKIKQINKAEPVTQSKCGGCPKKSKCAEAEKTESSTT
jgi:hypothetical protein